MILSRSLSRRTVNSMAKNHFIMKCTSNIQFGVCIYGMYVKQNVAKPLKNIGTFPSVMLLVG